MGYRCTTVAIACVVALVGGSLSGCGGTNSHSSDAQSSADGAVDSRSDKRDGAATDGASLDGGDAGNRGDGGPLLEPGLMVAAGYELSCEVRLDGGLYCWGKNTGGILGEDVVMSATPVRIGTDSDWVRIAVGQHHACGLKTSGALYCMGPARLFTDATGIGNVGPTRIGIDANWVDVVVGRDFQCALKSGGALYCWGGNSVGQLALADTRLVVPTPKRVLPGRVLSQISATHDHACAIDTDQKLLCWGGNFSLQLGVAAATVPEFSTSPLEPLAASRFVHVSAGAAYTCAVDDKGALWCWGANSNGTLGPTEVSPSLPGRVNDDDDWVAVQAGWNHTCAFKSDDSLHCWGLKIYGQLGRGFGQGPTRLFIEPQLVPTDDPFTAVSLGLNHSCGIRDGKRLCWGSDARGHLADGDAAIALVPEPTSAGTAFASIDAGYSRACGVSQQGDVLCWGHGVVQIQNGFAMTPAKVTEGPGWQQVSGRTNHACAVKGDGTLVCWGVNSHGELGIGDEPYVQLEVVEVTALSDVTQVCTGGLFDPYSCAVAGGALYCWGARRSEVLGPGVTVDAKSPVRIGAADGWTQVTCGDGYACGVESGKLYCWGKAGDHLGLGPVSATVGLPTLASAATGWSKVSTTYETTCAVRDGALYCWGRGRYLGSGHSGVDADVPERVGTASDWGDISAGSGHTCGVRSGVLYCWGGNQSGQLGTGTLDAVQTPTQVGTDTTWSKVATGATSTCAIKSTGTLHCWGSNAVGELGQGAIFAESP